MYKINDKVYVFLKGTHNNAIALNGLHRNRFGTIIDIRENVDKATYIVKMDITDKEIMVQEDHGIFTFYDMNELLDAIRSLDVSESVKEKYAELINRILQNEEMENIQYRF